MISRYKGEIGWIKKSGSFGSLHIPGNFISIPMTFFVPIVLLTHRLIPIDLVVFKLVFDRRNIEVSYRPSLGIEDTIQG